jgi:hypothetical protein
MNVDDPGFQSFDPPTTTRPLADPKDFPKPLGSSGSLLHPGPRGWALSLTLAPVPVSGPAYQPSGLSLQLLHRLREERRLPLRLTLPIQRLHHRLVHALAERRASGP